MATVSEVIPELHPGDHLARAEFLRRWETMRQLTRAELIGGVVYMPSPLSIDHGRSDNSANTWLGVYAANTPGCDASSNATWLMLKDVPQPDAALCILPEYGGQSSIKGKYGAGAPELIVEVCVSSASFDLHPKLKLYQKAGVKEYVAILVEEQQIRWHRLIDGKYQLMAPEADGLWRSVIFPGLWLDGAALLKGQLAQVLSVLQQGIASPEHARFVAELNRRFSTEGKVRTAPSLGKKKRKPKKPK